MYEPRSMKSVMAAFRVQMAISEIAIAVGILTMVPDSFMARRKSSGGFFRSRISIRF
jgi:hypothetical protein